MENTTLIIDKINQSLFLQAVYEGTIEIMGKTKTELIFSAISYEIGNGGVIENITPKIFADIGNEFAIRYHINTAKGLMLRIGEASFSYLRKKNQKLKEMGKIENRLKPIAKRFEESLESLAENLSELTALKIRAKKTNDSAYSLEIVDDEIEKIFSSDLHLYFFMGLLRAFSGWLDSRKEYSFQINENKNGSSMGNKVNLQFKNLE